MKATTRAKLSRWMRLPEDCDDGTLMSALHYATRKTTLTDDYLDELAERVASGFIFLNPPGDSTAITLRDRLAMSASEEDIEEVIEDGLQARHSEKVVFTSRQQARYEHADRMLKARVEKH